jgi:hypothetical protein
MNPAMNTISEPPIKSPGTAQKKSRRRLGGKFLVVSIVVHLLFGIGATYWVVQTISKRKLTFKAGPPSPNPAQKAAEHKVQMQKKQQASSAPAQAKRIATTGMAKITLPDMPLMPAMSNTVTPNVMTGMGGTGVGLGMQGGSGTGGGGGGGMPFFGLKTQSGGALKGTLFDLKQDRNRHPVKMDVKKFDETIVKFGRSNLNENLLSGYFRTTQALYTTQFYIPDLPSKEGPEAFDLKGKVGPNFWIVHYKGRVLAPATGKFHFVGQGDDVMYVKFSGRLVLDACWFKSDLVRAEAVYEYGSTAFPHPYKKGAAIEVEAGKSYTIEVVIGDHGGNVDACLLMEQEGVDYKKDAKGNPILPVFRLAAGKLPAVRRGTPLPVVEDGPVWKGVVGSDKPASALDALKANQ